MTTVSVDILPGQVCGERSYRLLPLLGFSLSSCLAYINSTENVRNFPITQLLNSLLEGYNRHLRPNFGGERVTSYVVTSRDVITSARMTLRLSGVCVTNGSVTSVTSTLTTPNSDKSLIIFLLPIMEYFYE